MKIILLDTIFKLGLFGDKVNVRPGYARNFLIPKNKAVIATKKNIKIFEEQRYMLERQLIIAKNISKDRISKINKLGEVTIKLKTNSKGKLFGSVNSSDIARLITSAGIKLFKNEVFLPPKEVIRKIGVYKIKININNEVNTYININIKSQNT